MHEVKFERAAEVLTPSPVSPRLMKAPVASHPLPQGGEGCGLNLMPALKKTVTLVLGGARSGKSHYAQELASAFERVVYIATASRDDAEMRAKIAHHRR